MFALFMLCEFCATCIGCNLILYDLYFFLRLQRMLALRRIQPFTALVKSILSIDTGIAPLIGSPLFRLGLQYSLKALSLLGVLKATALG